MFCIESGVSSFFRRLIMLWCINYYKMLSFFVLSDSINIMAALPQPSKKYVGTGFAPSVKAAFVCKVIFLLYCLIRFMFRVDITLYVVIFWMDQLMAGYLNKEKSSDLAALLGAWNKRYFTFDGKVLNYFQDEDTAFMGPSGSTFLRFLIF